MAPVNDVRRRMVTQYVFCGFLAVALFYLLAEHRAHLFGVLPFLILLACPVMHLFMHHGHGDHGSPGSKPDANPPSSDHAHHPS
jgi:DUF2933 family protein